MKWKHSKIKKLEKNYLGINRVLDFQRWLLYCYWIFLGYFLNLHDYFLKRAKESFFSMYAFPKRICLYFLVKTNRQLAKFNYLSSPLNTFQNSTWIWLVPKILEIVAILYKQQCWYGKHSRYSIAFFGTSRLLTLNYTLNYTLGSLRRVYKQKIEMFNYLKN